MTRQDDLNDAQTTDDLKEWLSPAPNHDGQDACIDNVRDATAPSQPRLQQRERLNGGQSCNHD